MDAADKINHLAEELTEEPSAQVVLMTVAAMLKEGNISDLRSLAGVSASYCSRRLNEMAEARN